MNRDKQSAVRKFLKRQHAELIAVKRAHVKRGVKAVQPHKDELAAKIDSWSSDGKLQPHQAPMAKRWAAASAAALGVSMWKSLRALSRDASQLAADHAEQFTSLAANVFGDDSVDLDEPDEYEDDDERLGQLQASYLGNGRRGVFKAFAAITKAVVVGMALSDFADQIGADSDDPDDIADAVFSPVESRTEMYIRTETGRVYGSELADVAGTDDELQKRWATIDPGCEEVCHPADGQVVDMDDLFEMGNGDLVDFPPSHPNCDCEWLPWKEQYGDMKSTDDLEAA